MSTTVPAPADFGIDVLAVPAGTDVDLQLRLESVVDGVLVSGTARARVAGECVRCLDALERELEVDFQELYAYAVEPDRAGSGRVGRAGHSRHDGPEPGAEEEDEVLTLHGDLLDLESVVRDAVVLALPLAPVCREDCPGLCAQCGARLADDPQHTHGAVDIRWAALQGLTTEHDRHDPLDPNDSHDSHDSHDSNTVKTQES